MWKFLIVGSGPQAAKWWNWNRSELQSGGWLVCPINTALGFVSHDAHWWFRSNDFFQTATYKPSKVVVDRTAAVVGFLQRPRWYKHWVDEQKIAGSGTMLLNSLFHVLNVVDLLNLRDTHVAVVGSDMIYDGEETHWYGKGKPDPLRYGEAWLEGQLDFTKHAYAEAGVMLWNMSEAEKTRLPFPRLHINTLRNATTHENALRAVSALNR